MRLSMLLLATILYPLRNLRERKGGGGERARDPILT